MMPFKPRMRLFSVLRSAPAARRFATEARLTSDHVRIVEVGPRDGLQNEKKAIPLETKLQLISKLAKTGLTTIEAGSFVPAKWVPQMASTAEICEHLLQSPPEAQNVIAYNYLVPNVRGLENLIKVLDATGVPADTPLKSSTTTEISLFAAATEAFSKANTNCTIDESLERIRPVVALAKTRNIRVRGYVSVALGCPYEGPEVSPVKVADITRSLLEMGADEVSVADTTGMGTAPRTMELLQALRAAGIANTDLALHFHDTYGQALVNTIVGLEHGIRVFDSSVGGLGGCPYSKGATGNISTEDLVHTIHSLGMNTGVNLEEMARIGAWISGELGRFNESRAGKAILARSEEVSPLHPPSLVMSSSSRVDEPSMLPLPGAPSSSWAQFRGRLAALFHGADPRVCVAFWLFGLINNVLYVVILSAALDLVGPDLPKGVVLLADVIPSFGTKLVAPYFIQVVPYPVRVLIFVTFSTTGMLLVALSPAYTDGGTISTKLAGIILSSMSSGGGELSFLALTHHYGPFSLAAWGSGTGAAGLVGAGAYALLTTSFGFSVKATLLASAFLPAVMVISFFTILPQSPVRSFSAGRAGHRSREEMDRYDDNDEREQLLDSSSDVSQAQKATVASDSGLGWQTFKANLRRSKGLFFPFMLPLLLVYVAEYTINQGIAPTLLFPLKDSPFDHYRAFYPAYNAIYQVGVFISRSSTPFFRVHDLYFPSLLQFLNLVILTLHSLFNFIPSVWLVFGIVFWEGLLGGIVYVSTFAEIADRVPVAEREFSLGATTVSDSGGVCIAGFISMAFEVWLSTQWHPARSRSVEHFLTNGPDHLLGRPSTKFRKIQVLAVFAFWSLYLTRGNKHGPPVIRKLSSRLTEKLSAWQTTVIIFLWLYVSRNFAKIVGLECPEPLANLYSRSFFRATWIATALDAGFWTAMKVKPKWLRDIASLVFTVYYLIAAERADEKVRRVRATLTLEHMRVSWNKGTSPYLWALANLARPRLTKHAPRAIRIPRPSSSIYDQPTNAWLYFDGPLSALRDQTCIVLDIPGGGFVSMSPRNSEDRLLSWAARTKVPILSLDYKKAPEFPYPYALNECYDVYHTLVSTRGRCIGLNGQTHPRIVVTGDSAGANLAVGMTLMVLQSGSADASHWQGQNVLPRPDGLVLAYPALNMKIESWMTEEQMALIQEKSTRRTNQNILQRKNMDYQRLTPFTSPGASFADLQQDSCSDLDLEVSNLPEKATRKLARHKSALQAQEAEAAAVAEHQPKQIRTRLAVSSVISYVQDRVLTPEMMRAMIILYIGPHNRPDFNTDYLLSPTLAPEALLARFPKTYIITGERDPLVDDTVIFAGRLRQAKLRHFQERQDLGLEKSHRAFNDKDHVEVSLLPGVSHGFMQMAGFFPESWKHISRCASWISELFELSASKTSSSSILVQSLHDPDQIATKKKSHPPPLHSIHHLLHNHRTRNRNHKRRLTGESSADEDKPLEMSISKLTPLTPLCSSKSVGRTAPNGDPDPEANGATRIRSVSRGRSTAPGTKVQHRVPAKLSLPPEDPEEEEEGYASEDYQSPVAMIALRERNRSMNSLASEEDLLDRRMSGLAGGLMGIGEGARTP
ncbi:CLN3-domain-containing protein [Aspergillus homomorphus CBS 101889]|uniref:CLN3-domain-containing protein n=1 Tax=Aspergillus homomorphus (strain CBS 101889) TaxID=1450537 RepID=A0A395ICH6_ASPHC|nr:CLN3-domain-containing protein [Aspergillus homomorphus CBS 101889]RAL17756.1 CLN3-domain-containing protein [Aspergillus homomorphus CBS 101889]